jgi:hypothetical protein
VKIEIGIAKKKSSNEQFDTKKPANGASERLNPRK